MQVNTVIRRTDAGKRTRLYVCVCVVGEETIIMTAVTWSTVLDPVQEIVSGLTVRAVRVPCNALPRRQSRRAEIKTVPRGQQRDYTERTEERVVIDGPPVCNASSAPPPPRARRTATNETDVSAL